MDTIVVLLSTFNGAKYLGEQLQSIRDQVVDAHISVLARDDGSSDCTIRILMDWAGRMEMPVLTGSNVGPKESFLALMAAAPDADYYAFCDQDDVWLPEKLQSALEVLRGSRGNAPCMYFSNLDMVDKNGHELGEMYLKAKPRLNLGALLVRNPAAGCTIVFNRAAMSVWRASEIHETTLHDTLMTRICYLTGEVFYDPRSFIHYRQHEANFAGRKASFRKLMRQRYRVWCKADGSTISAQAQALLDHLPNLRETDIDILCEFVDYRKNILTRARLAGDRTIFSEDRRVNRSFGVRALLGLV